MTPNADSGHVIRTVTLSVQVTIGDDTDLEPLAEKLFDFLANDPDDLFPEILTVQNFDFEVDHVTEDNPSPDDRPGAAG